MFARRHSNRLPSTLEQRLRISITMTLHFFYPPCTSRENWVRSTTSFKLAIEIFSIIKTLTSDDFDKLAFSLNKKFTDDAIFSHADTLTGCPLDANSIIKFRAYKRLICCYPPRIPPRMSRETWLGMSMAFSSSMKIFLTYVPGMHVVVFTRSSFTWASASTPSAVAYCNTLKYTKRTKPSADTCAIDPWVRVVSSFLCASLIQSVFVRVGDYVFLVATWNLFVIFTRHRMPLLGAFSCRPSVPPEPSAARMPWLILWLSPTGYCSGERHNNSLFVLECTSSRVWFL